MTVPATLPTPEDFERFRRRHPDKAPDFLYMREVYGRCQLVAEPTPQNPEAVYVHIFGSRKTAKCERCEPGFYREKRILERRVEL